MKKIFTFGVSLVAILIFLGLMPVHGEAEIYDNVIRLHVLANSNSEEDQALKLKVRDTVLDMVSKICDKNDCNNVEEAQSVIIAHSAEIKQAAEARIQEEGYQYDVSVVLGEENYPTRNYESLAFPRGKYISLRINIGEGEGENWWCVLFPPLCVSSACDKTTKAENTFVELGFSSEQYKIITDSENVTYNVRFKILEAIEGVLT